MVKMLFTTKKLTEVQLEEIGEFHQDLQYLASMDITSIEEALEIMDEIRYLAQRDDISLYGEFPALMRAAFCQENYEGKHVESFQILKTFESFNDEWILTGIYRL